MVRMQDFIIDVKSIRFHQRCICFPFLCFSLFPPQMENNQDMAFRGFMVLFSLSLSDDEENGGLSECVCVSVCPQPILHPAILS